MPDPDPVPYDPGHSPERPSWNCRDCGVPWPCEPARKQMIADLDSIQLAMYLWLCLEEAAGDLPGMPVADGFARFISWTRPGGLPNIY